VLCGAGSGRASPPERAGFIKSRVRCAGLAAVSPGRAALRLGFRLRPPGSALALDVFFSRFVNFSRIVPSFLAVSIFIWKSCVLAVRQAGRILKRFIYFKGLAFADRN